LSSQAKGKKKREKNDDAALKQLSQTHREGSEKAGKKAAG